ncbi:MAG TPA: chemotaxis protein CheA [Desulfuromonadales bacterium]|nr:chemotaxis protein CheA [Desulfuromonadales bacterium]
MNPLLVQFLSEARDTLYDIGQKLMQLEQTPDNADLMNELFRPVHTLKGNSGLFDFPEMTRVLHAGEDLMVAVRDGRVVYSREIADCLLDAMDFVGQLCDEIEQGITEVSHIDDAVRLADALRKLIAVNAARTDRVESLDNIGVPEQPKPTNFIKSKNLFSLAPVPETIRMDAFRRILKGDPLHRLVYSPVEDCFFQGDDPLHQAQQTPDVLWCAIVARESWPNLVDLDAYRCVLVFNLLTAAPSEELVELYRYVPDQVVIQPVDPLHLVIPTGDPNGGPVYEDFVAEALLHLDGGNLASLGRAARTMLELSNPDLWLSSALRWLLLLLENMPSNRAVLRTLIESLRTLTPPDWSLTDHDAAEPATEGLSENVTDSLNSLSEEDAFERDVILDAQRQILMLQDQPAWHSGRLKAVATTLINCCAAMGEIQTAAEIEAALKTGLETGSGGLLLDWLNARIGMPTLRANLSEIVQSPQGQQQTGNVISAFTDEGPKFGRRAEDQIGPRSLKVDQVKIDLLMNLIGEMVVSKNALPYLAQRAENQFGAREVAREIKAQYTVINRIVEEMQGAIMQVRMMPVSFVFQRFPRLVRDISRKLGKEVNLVLEGEETEADKNIIESLADPLIHIVRNSLDHGLETPEIRQSCGKSAAGTLIIRAKQEADRVLIEIIDDGKGIDPEVIKRKAYEKGIIDETTLEQISDRDSVNLVFGAGFSTAETVSDLSGRGVGMDVVRTGVERVNGAIQLESEVGKGTHIRISLPLSMAVTKVMIIESDGQIFGVPMDHVVETVRIRRRAIHTIKQSKTTVLRGRIVALKALNVLLEIPAEPRVNDDELAVLVVRVGSEPVGLIVDDFHETVDVIQKPLEGVLSGLSVYSGSALMGDGSVLMVLNMKEMV